MLADTAAGLTVRDVARRYRVGEDKVRAWIGRGELAAVNTAAVLCGRPRWVILPDALVAFERRRAGGPPPKPARRKRRVTEIDYFPDTPAGGGGGRRA
jgi:transposase